MGENIDLLFEQARMALSAGVRPGDVLVGKYRVDAILGMGGMGVVIAAHHLNLDERVAIKLLLPEALSRPEAVRRFAREARAAVKIKSEHSARILDVGTLEDGSPFMVMEYLDGEDLATRIARTGPFDIEDAVEVILQASEAIAEAHALGIIHRDLKPANLFCVRGPDGRSSIKVLDFGISKLTRPVGDGSGSTTMTNTNIILGSPFYMSPEQMQGSDKIDIRADVWSLGVILYQLLTGDLPFNGDTWPQVCACVATRPAPRLRRFRPDARPALETVVSRCLEKDPRKRYPDVAALAADLAPFAPKHARISVSRISLTVRHTSLAASTISIPARTSKTESEPARKMPSWRAAPTASRWFQSSATAWAAAGTLAVATIAVLWSRAESRSTAPVAAAVPLAFPVQPSGLPIERMASAAQDSLPVAAAPPTTANSDHALAPGAVRSQAGGRGVHPSPTRALSPAALRGGPDGGAAVPAANEECALCERQ